VYFHYPIVLKKTNMKKSNIFKRIAAAYLRQFFFLLANVVLCNFISYAQPATNTIPVGIGRPCGAASGTADSVMYFNYTPGASSITRMSSCKPSLAAPGLASSATSISFNPADGYIYLIRFRSSSGIFTSYVWRWLPGTCPAASLPVYQTYPNQMIAGLDFDASGIGYQISFTGASAPYGLALQKIDFVTGTFGPIINIDLQGKKVYTQNGDLVITPSGQFLMVWDNKYFSLNYTDYNTAIPLKATFIDTLALSGTAKLVGLAYAQGKLVGSASRSSSGVCSYYDFNILNGGLSSLTAGASTQYSADMTNITSGIGAAKKLVSATPVSAGTYDLVYDIRVENFGDYPISNLQVKEDLTTIHPLGAGAISNVSTEWVNNPAGIVLNSSYNGTTDKNLITTSPSQTLPNYPVAKNYFIIRVKCRLSSVVAGVVYYNNASVTGKGYNNVSLQDSSTNGNEPDLNSNNMPDDAGEKQSTPFSVSVAAESPPCTSISNILYNQSFGSGTGITTVLPGTVTTDYAAGTNPMNEETYMLTNDANNGNTTKYVNLTDHTGNSNGRMLLVNADVQNYKVFEDVVAITCVNLKYSFLLYAANVANSSYNTFCNAFGGTKQPKFTFIVRNAITNAIIANYSTPDITVASWNLYGLKWVMPAGVTSVRLQVYNTGEGGCGNVIAVDDIQFGLCDPQPTVSASLPSAGCIGGSTVIGASLSDTTGMSSLLQYQWQSYTNPVMGWTNIATGTSSKLTINPVTLSDQKQYRLIVAANGNLGNAACQYTSNSILLSLKDSSSSAANAFSNKAFACPGEPVQLSVSGGLLGTNASWRWYEAACDSIYKGSGSTITVYPIATTTYYVKAAGDCNSTLCVPVTVPMFCVLSDELVNLKGLIEQNYTRLQIAIRMDKKIRYFELERSINATDFIVVEKETIDNYANMQGYKMTDNIVFITGNTIYYRVKIVTESGEIIYSNISTISRNKDSFKVSLVPNPATTTAKVMYFMPSAAKVSIRLFNAQGQLMYYSNANSIAGNNIFQFNELNKLPAGVYNVSITGSTANNIKFMIHR
jgi:hypothetical protein